MNSFNAATKSSQGNQTDVWITPQWIIDKLCYFDLDPCGYLIDGFPIVATAKRYFTEVEDGLRQDWQGFVFVNFPYSQSYDWLKKCSEEYAKGNCEIVILCFVRSDTDAWQHNLKGCTGLNLMDKRIKFLDKFGKEKSNGAAPSCLIAYGEDAFKRIKNVPGLVFRYGD